MTDEALGRSSLQSIMAMASAMHFAGRTPAGGRTQEGYRAAGRIWETLDPSDQTRVALGMTALVIDGLEEKAMATGVSVDEILAVYGITAATVQFDGPENAEGTET